MTINYTMNVLHSENMNMQATTSPKRKQEIFKYLYFQKLFQENVIYFST